MDVFGAVVLIIVMYFVIPIGVCVAALIAMGGAERFLPPAMRARATARRTQRPEGH